MRALEKRKDSLPTGSCPLASLKMCGSPKLCRHIELAAHALRSRSTGRAKIQGNVFVPTNVQRHLLRTTAVGEVQRNLLRTAIRSAAIRAQIDCDLISTGVSDADGIAIRGTLIVAALSAIAGSMMMVMMVHG